MANPYPVDFTEGVLANPEFSIYAADGAQIEPTPALLLDSYALGVLITLKDAHPDARFHITDTPPQLSLALAIERNADAFVLNVLVQAESYNTEAETFGADLCGIPLRGYATPVSPYAVSLCQAKLPGSMEAARLEGTLNGKAMCLGNWHESKPLSETLCQQALHAVLTKG